MDGIGSELVDFSRAGRLLIFDTLVREEPLDEDEEEDELDDEDEDEDEEDGNSDGYSE